jgi:hypothetical protein
MATMTTDLKSLKRVGWGTRAVFTLGIAASLAGNVLHAQDNVISQAISAWSPLALLLAVELISRVPARRGTESVVRLAATAVIAGIAAWVSYWHMAGVASRYGEEGASPYLLPVSVDGLIVVASISLVEISGRIRALSAATAEPVQAAAPPAAALELGVPTTEVIPTEPPAVEPVQVTERPVKKATPVRAVKRQPSAAERVARAVARTPDATPAQIAARLELSERTVQRHMPKPVDSVSTDHTPALTAA